MSKRTISLKDIKNKSGFKCEKIYPVESYNKDGKEFKTINFRLTQEQAVELAKNLLIASKNWDEISVTAFRSTKQVTVTGKES